MIARYLVVLMALVAGCASQTTSTPTPAPAPRAKVNLSGYPLEFRQGYADGCASADTARRRDEGRFKSDASYAQGWQDGYDICRRKK